MSIKNWQLISFLFLFYFAVFSLYTYPFVFEAGSFLIGKNDAFQFVWNSFDFAKKVETGNLLHSYLMFHPWGESSLMHAGTLSASILSLLGDNLLITNLYLISHSILAAIGAFLLARHFKLTFIACLVTGFVFAFSPYKMARLSEHYNLAMTGFVPFFTLAYLKSFNFKEFRFFPKILSRKQLCIALCMGMLQAITDFVVMFHMLYFAGIILLFFYIKKAYKQLGWKLTTGIIVSTISLIHFTVRFLVKNNFNDNGALWWGGYWKDFIRPDNGLFFENMIGHNLREFGERYAQGLEGTAFMGYSLLTVFLLSVLWMIIANRQKASILLFSICCILLIAIPEPLGYQKLYSPFSILHFVPGLNQLRCPERIVNYLYLIIPIFSFIQLKDFCSYIMRRRLCSISLIMLFAGLFIEYFPSKFDFTDFASVPKAVSELKKENIDAVLIYPFGIKDGYSQQGRFEVEQFQFQMAHEKKQLGGYFSRVSDDVRKKYLDIPFIQDLISAQDGVDCLPKRNYKNDIKTLNFSAALILDKYEQETGAQFLRKVLIESGFTEQIYADGTIYRLQ